ncbi:amidohydrolase [Enterococcus sp.]|uniref:amidohydrolase n=1 Tax=Enterococcus sp. TaxID=35783 RepID=UPI002FC9D186
MILRSNAIFDTQTKTTFAGYIQIQDEEIIAVGPLNECPSDAEVIDCGDQMIIPSFIDCHVHFFLSALMHAGKLTALQGSSEAAFAQQVPDLPTIHGWKIGIGWFGSDFGQNVYPTKESLDKYCADVPVLLIAGDAHSIWLNTKGMQQLGMTVQNIPQGMSGEALISQGELTGCFLEAVAIHYLAHVLKVFQKETPEIYLAYMQQLNQMGVTTIGDVALTGESWDDLIYPENYQAIEDAATVRAVFYPAMREELSNLQKIAATYQSAKVQMGGVKQFFDGVTSTHTAFLKDVYETPYYQGDVGGPLIPVEQMRQFILMANQQGWPMRIHTIGDEAIHQALLYFKESQREFPLESGKFNTLEHLEVMDPIDLAEVGQEQLVISVQPSHLLVGYETLDEEVGTKRAAKMFPFQSFLNHGATLAFGTDSPVVVGVTPLESIYYAVARREKSGVPVERLMPAEVLSIAESLYAQTKGAAQALSRQDIGEIRVGMKADLCLLSRNLLTCSEEEILTTNVNATMMNGQFVYQR